MTARLLSLTLFICGYAATYADSTIVQWGAPNGETDIVSANTDFNRKDTTYSQVEASSPTAADYYNSASGRTPHFHHAATVSGNTKRVQDDASGDFISSGKNSATYETMICWENFLTADSTLTSLSSTVRISGGATDAANLRWVIRKGDGNWYASEPISITINWETYTTGDPGGLTWYHFTPLTSGSAVVGSVATIDMIGVEALGFYGFFDNTDGNPWRGVHLRYFKATASQPPIARITHDTGYTISNVRTAWKSGERILIASSYDGRVIALDYDDGTILWENALSGFYNHDIWCDDLDGDGDDEVLAANADGKLYCIGSDGQDLWTFAPRTGDHAPPMNAVCVIRNGSTPYVVCGGYDMNLYYLSLSGNLLAPSQPHLTIPASGYSIESAWGDNPPPNNRHIANFLRPVKQSDGSEKLAVHGAQNSNAGNGSIYIFSPLATTPSYSNSISLNDPAGHMHAADVDGDGTEELLLGTSTHVNGADFQVVDYNDNSLTDFPIRDYKTELGGFGYFVVQPILVPDGATSRYLILIGNHIMLLPLDLDPAGMEVISGGTYSYNDIWRDPETGDIILASAQSGGSCVHIFNITAPNWKTEFTELTPPGKISTLLANTQTARTQLAAFTAPSWERAPLPVVLMTEGTTDVEALATDIQNNYDSPIILNGFGVNSQLPADWDRDTVLAANPTYRDKRDSRKDYNLTASEITTTVQSEFNANPDGVAFWGGHGNDPFFYDPELTKSFMTYGQSEGKMTVLIYPEVTDHSDDFAFVWNHLFEPLAIHARSNNTKLYIRTKNIFWQSEVYATSEPSGLDLWQELMNGNYADVFVPSMEETTSKTMELSVAGRLGIWASGAVDDWGSRCARDNVSYNRLRQHADQNLPNHFLRDMVYRVASGATYLNNFSVDQTYFSFLWELIAEGALYVPKREEIVSFNPVHLSMAEPDEHYIEEGTDTKWLTWFDETTENANPLVFSHLNGTWPASPVTDWDFSKYAAGVNDRRLHFLPPYEHGMVLITPPQAGDHAAATPARGAMIDHIHPMYRNIMTEYITDGRDYLDSTGNGKHDAKTYYTTVEADILANKSKLPITVSGGVAWVTAQSAPTHLRLTLVDSGYLNPEERTAIIHFHTVQPVQVKDLLSGETFSVNNGSTTITVPLGLFRFMDIELDEPFFPENDWGTFASVHGLSGNSRSDKDLDGMSDLHEFALGGDPLDPSDTGTPPQLTLNFDSHTASYFNVQLSSVTAGIHYEAQWKEDLRLGNWNTTWGTESNTTPGNPMELFERTLDTTDRAQLFFRLKISQP
ncbi:MULTISPECIES: PQQ-binding-like beta-propeller repeat protein [unclassified Lentimonas]|uniref:outer membrane protein assembly factor BamB family protein n=1 Tax=unclassified Lentimonas TaxID=2630993 RepID=UPI001322ACD0|nr:MULTISPECIES: PQQ-binding-like beta-propeller repeat protein [unclassified Lentimonas]CAA6676284.1 Unannotated [Lentimonas sp. CC4]CAA6683826.1 Unannotated [Lentimonas sp. CC6]CAA7077775.1 Unannotated [Lentimonas sp. CC4]CAA7169709.1 Unannotated [Lentimonas sp. CC21]CAA7179530.1 Unannotated [Lentimonas sp. CC8]